jgi:hypothetical protein
VTLDRQHDVRWLQITVDDASTMGFVERLDDVVGDIEQLGRCQTAVASNRIERPSMYSSTRKLRPPSSPTSWILQMNG